MHIYLNTYIHTCIHVFIRLFVLSSPRGKIPQKDMEVTFPGMSGDFTSENFSATWYLIENHSGSRLVILCLCDFVPLSLSAHENIIVEASVKL